MSRFLDPRIEDRREVDVPEIDLRRLLDPTPLEDSVLPKQYLSPTGYDMRDIPPPSPMSSTIEKDLGRADLDRAAKLQKVIEVFTLEEALKKQKEMKRGK